MVRLKNLEKNNHIIKCDIFPEDSLSGGSLMYDAANERVIQYYLPEGYTWCVNHVAHAVNAIREMIAAGSSFPSEKLLMWV